MKRFATIFVLVFVLVPATSHAEKKFKGKSTENQTWDCATDPNVKITQDKGTFGLLGECKKVTIAGKKNVVTIASTAKVIVSGTGNLVQVEEVDSIAVSGKANSITWTKAKTGDKPKITKGRGNTVEKK